MRLGTGRSPALYTACLSDLSSFSGKKLLCVGGNCPGTALEIAAREAFEHGGVKGAWVLIRGSVFTLKLALITQPFDFIRPNLAKRSVSQ